LRRAYLVLGLALGSSAASAHGQVFRPRAADYLFSSSAEDVRAIWLNPAGLAAVPEASLLGGVVLERPDTGSIRVSQWEAGFNSRGLALAYLRDRLPSGEANEAIRFGISRGFPRWSVGIAATLYRTDVTERGVDIGFRGRPTGAVDIGLAVTNIGQPRLRGLALPAVGVGSVTWRALGGVIQISGEMAAANRLESSGYDLAYRGGARLTVPAPLPIAAFTAFDVDGDFDLARWSVGIAVGGDRRAILVGTGLAGIPSRRNLDLFSVSALARNRFAYPFR